MAAEKPTTLSSKLQDAVNAYVESETIGEGVRVEMLPIITEALAKQEIQLLELVLFMDPALNDTANPQGRRWATMLLAECLREVKSLRLNFKHVETLVCFFCSRISDWQGVEGAACGLLAILRYHAPPLRTLQDADGNPMATFIARAAFKEVNMQSHTQGVRKAVLDLVGALMDDWTAEVQAMGMELGEGVNNVIEEERDPRNLLLCFNLVAKLFDKYPEPCVTKEALGQLFEALTSYFPITFTPPKEDKYGITGKDLRDGLANALASTARFSDQLLPFLLDNTKDITVGDNEESISQALELLGYVFERYGPKVTQQWIGKVLSTAWDQSCRTETPCPLGFAEMVRRALAAALSDVPAGLTPSWLSREVSPGITVLAMGAARGEDSLATEGARRLLLAAAASGPLLAERVWGLVVPKLLGAQDAKGGEEAEAVEESKDAAAPEKLQLGAVTFVLALAKIAEGKNGKPVLAARQLKQALAASLAALVDVHKGDAFAHEVIEIPNKTGVLPEGQVLEAVTSGPKGLAALLLLVAKLAQLSGPEASSEAFAALATMLFPPASEAGSADLAAWGSEWRGELSHLGDEGDSRTAALLQAVIDVIRTQSRRAEDLMPSLIKAADALRPAFAPPPRTEAASPAPAAMAPWLRAAMPRLLAETGLSLAHLATSETAHDPAVADALDESLDVLQHAAAMCTWGEGEGQAAESCAAMHAIAQALDVTIASEAECQWSATRLAKSLKLPQELPQLCAGPKDAESLAHRALAVRYLVKGLCAHLPAAAASEMRRAVLANATKATDGERFAAVTLVPAALPALATEDWAACSAALPNVCREAGNSAEVVLELPALAALEALVESCPGPQVEGLLKSIHNTFDHLMEVGAADAKDKQGPAKGATRCWAATALGLLRRGGFAPQAMAFMEVLLDALRKGALVAEFVPLAFHVLMPPRYDPEDSGDDAPVGMPSLSVQHLAFTALPKLVELAKEKGLLGDAPGAKLVMRSALQSAVALLCAMPIDAASADFSDELRWCTLTGLRLAGEDAAAPLLRDIPTHEAPFAVQVLQLLVRAASKGLPWVEDDLQTIVPQLTGPCVTHRVPLVRMGCLQALKVLVESSYGHLLPYKKSINSATKRAVEDKRREVRLLAVASLNAWECGGTPAN